MCQVVDAIFLVSGPDRDPRPRGDGLGWRPVSAPVLVRGSLLCLLLAGLCLVGGCETFTESLILAQDERWRRA